MNIGHARTARFESATHEGLTRDVLIMSFASAVVIGLSFILAVLGVPVDEIDRWTLILSAPWFATLYLLSRKIDLLARTLARAVLATTGAAAAIAGTLYSFPYFFSDMLNHVLDKFHFW